MELEGFLRCRQSLEERELECGSITTDRHISITAYIKKKWPEIEHKFDTWHIGKG